MHANAAGITYVLCHAIYYLQIKTGQCSQESSNLSMPMMPSLEFRIIKLCLINAMLAINNLLLLKYITCIGLYDVDQTKIST